VLPSADARAKEVSVRATPAERAHFELIGDGLGIHWPDVDEDLSVAGLLRGTPSASR